MAINFPDAPSPNDTHTVGATTWQWDGTVWNGFGATALTQINATDTTSDATLFPVMVTAAGSAEAANVTTSKLGFDSTTGTLTITGTLNATTKSFLIDHPTKPDMKLQHGSLEGPENGVYARGRLTDSNVIYLPDYWPALVNPNSITVNLTPIGPHQHYYVKEITNNTIIVGGGTNCFYTVYAERIDVDKLRVEV